MPRITELTISEAERRAILLALPLADEVIIPNPVNASIVSMSVESATTKLQSNKFRFSNAEIRAITIAVSSAVMICTGQASGFFDSEATISKWRDKLVPHYFVLNKLQPVLQHYVDVHLL